MIGPLLSRHRITSTPERSGHAPIQIRPPKIRLENVSVCFEGRRDRVHALSDIHLEIHPGEFVCLVGPSGCGKSTLLNVIAGLMPVNEGSIYKDGQPVRGAGPDRAVIFQDAALFPWLSTVQNVEFSLQHVRDRKERRERAVEYLKKVHLGRFADARPHELSGGMRQRVAIARALALEPDVLLMDEPFAALDAQTRDMLIAEVQRLWLETRKTIVFVTHNVLEAVTLGDRVICMGTRPGRIKRELHVQLARPRVVEDPDTARMAQRILADLRDEVAKIVQEESDIDTTVETADTRGGAAPLLHPDPGILGDGI